MQNSIDHDKVRGGKRRRLANTEAESTEEAELMDVSSETVVLLDTAGLLHTQTHSCCDCVHKMGTNQVSQNLCLDGGDAHEVPPLTEELLAADGCLGEEEVSLRVRPWKSSRRGSYTCVHTDSIK